MPPHRNFREVGNIRTRNFGKSHTLTRNPQALQNKTVFFCSHREGVLVALSLYLLPWYIFGCPAADVRHGHGPNARHCLAVLLTQDTAQNARIRLSSSTRSYLLCGRHLCRGHDLVEHSPEEFYFPMGRDTAAAALSLYVAVSPPGVGLGHGPYPRHCLVVLRSPEKAQNCCLRLSS